MTGEHLGTTTWYEGVLPLFPRRSWFFNGSYHLYLYVAYHEYLLPETLGKQLLLGSECYAVSSVPWHSTHQHRRPLIPGSGRLQRLRCHGGRVAAGTSSGPSWQSCLSVPSVSQTADGVRQSRTSQDETRVSSGTLRNNCSSVTALSEPTVAAAIYSPHQLPSSCSLSASAVQSGVVRYLTLAAVLSQTIAYITLKSNATRLMTT